MEIPGQNINPIQPQPILGALQGNNRIFAAPTPAQLHRFGHAHHRELFKDFITEAYFVCTPTYLQQAIGHEAKIAREAIEHRDVVYLLKIACFLTLFIGCVIKEVST